jgi:hypothetical protein
MDTKRLRAYKIIYTCGTEKHWLQASASTISYSGGANQPQSCWILAEALCQNPCNMSGMRAHKASTVQEAVVHVARNNKNWLRSGPAVRRGSHFQAHGDIPPAVFISRVMLRMRRQWEQQNRRFGKWPARPVISSHGPTVLTGGVPRHGAVKRYSASGPAGSTCACGKTLSLTDEACWMRK